MANTYNWKINKLDVKKEQDGLTDVVYDIHYTYTGTSSDTDDDGNAYTASMIGAKKIEAPDPENYIQFDQLTKDQVVAWLEESLEVDELNNTLDTIISELVTPSIESKNAPWL